jgi:hypothetical protein
MKAYQHAVLTDYIKRAILSGTMQDAAIASKYLAQVTGKKYDLCASALHTKYGIRVCPPECAERSMWCAKDLSTPVGYDKAKVKWVRADAPTEALANI